MFINKKLIMLLLGLIFVIGFTYADIISIIQKDRDVTINNSIKEELTTKGINIWNYEDKTTTDVMQRCLITNNNYNLPCSPKFKTYWVNCSEYNYLEQSYKDKNNITQIEKTLIDCKTEDNIYYTTKEKEDILNKWEKEKMEQIGKSIKIRREKVNLLTTTKGKVIIR